MKPSSFPAMFVWPDYAGGSIANVAPTAAALLSIPFIGLPPLRDHYWHPLAGDIRRVVIFIIDALGWNLIEQEQTALSSLLQRAVVKDKITSVFPSTTVNALSSIWTGVGPGQHGLVALRLLMPEQAVLGNMISWGANFTREVDTLVEAGVDPAKFLAVPGAAEQFAAAAIPTYDFKSFAFVDSPLSQMHGRGVKQRIGIRTPADMAVQVRQLLESKPNEPMVVTAYWHEVDNLSHYRGPHHETTAAEVRSVLHLIEEEIMVKMNAAARAHTALFIIADHGQIVTPPEQFIHLENHPKLQNLLFMRPAGEPRVVNFYARHGCEDDLLTYLNTHLGHAVWAIRAEEALAMGLYGPPPFAPNTQHRLGDVIAIMREGYTLFAPDEKKKAAQMIGRHAGLSQAEMEAPFLGFCL
ncbi:MAG: alkaline phosphatase family protein [Anaerolineae bacterium]|nr:alkaline phosphatase family protein [Anaerolineae bacterium]